MDLYDPTITDPAFYKVIFENERVRILEYRDDLSADVEAKFALEETRALLALGRVKDAAATAGGALEKIDALDAGDRGRGYLLLGEVFQSSGDTSRALDLLQLAVDTLERDGKPYLAEAARRLADLLEQEGRPDEALAVLKRAVGSDRAATPTPTPANVD